MESNTLPSTAGRDTCTMQETRAIQIIISLFRKYHITNKIKAMILINNIISNKTNSQTLLITSPQIINEPLSINTIITSPHDNESLLLNSILSQRLTAVNKLIQWYHIIKHHNIIKSFLAKKHTYYLITPSITESKELYLEIISNNGEAYRYNSTQCPITHNKVFYISKSSNHNLISKVRFMSDGLFIIDPKFNTDSDDDNRFYNIINFRKLQQEENDYIEQNKQFIKYLQSSTKKLKSIPSYNILPQQRLGLSKYNTKFQSMAVLSVNLKSILKQRPISRVASGRKIAFGNVDYSY